MLGWRAVQKAVPVSAIIVTELHRQQVEPAIPKELGSRVHFLPYDCRDIWEWPEKVYEYVKKNDIKQGL